MRKNTGGLIIKEIVKVGNYGQNDGNIRKLIKGDNSIVLDLIAKKYNKKVKCIYIDPPYNSGEQYNHYMDDKSHETWINELTNTLLKLKELLTEDGSIWISIDDKELHYLKVCADKVFGRKNFIHTIVWEHRTTRENRSIFSNNHEYVLVYVINKQQFKKSRNLLPPSNELLSRYKNPDNDERGPWQSISAHVQNGHAVESQYYEIKAPNGKIHNPPNGRCWAYNKEKMVREIQANNIWFGKDGNGVPRIKKFLKDKNIGLTPETLWKSEFTSTNKQAKKQLLKMFPDELVFDTPKPENLIRRILEIASNEGDLILDAYLGSGTTTAVAHKINRDYIGIEKGEHFHDLIVPRMKYVVDGCTEGISKDVNWNGGNGFEIYEVMDYKK